MEGQQRARVVLVTASVMEATEVEEAARRSSLEETARRSSLEGTICVHGFGGFEYDCLVASAVPVLFWQWQQSSGTETNIAVSKIYPLGLLPL